ncbi:MAG: DUF4390 domain-containing protein [Gammaproteobacteria bacterium]
MSTFTPRILHELLLSTVLAALLAGALAARSAHAGDIVIERAEAYVANELVMLDIDAGFAFSEDAVDALTSGIALTFDLEIVISEARRLLWDRELFATRRHYALERHALSNQFVLSDLITGERRIHASLALAIADLGRIHRLPLTERDELDSDGTLACSVRLKLDMNALPAPMIPLAYLSPGWHMSSGWHRWPADL